ncbi:MAG: N-acetylmuramoyl-L-alanine amidase [Bacillota bacterium]
MIRRIRYLTAALVLVLAMFSMVVLAEDKPALVVNGVALSSDVAPVIENGRALVPIRVLSETLGCTVEWDAAKRSVRVVNEGTEVVMVLNQEVAQVGDQKVKLDVPARLIDNRTMVPLRFVGTALGAGVDWNAQTRTVSAWRPVRVAVSEPEVTPAGTLVTVQGTGRLSPKSFQLANPSRLVIDLPYAKLDVSGKTIPVNSDGIIAVRLAQHEDTTSTARVVVDFEGPADHIKLLSSSDGRQLTIAAGHRITDAVSRAVDGGEELVFSFDGVVEPLLLTSSASERAGRILESETRLREIPGTNHNRIITLLNAGTQVKVLDIQSGWVQVRLSDGRVGWVAESLISVDPPIAGDQSAVPVTVVSGEGQEIRLMLPGISPSASLPQLILNSLVDKLALDPATSGDGACLTVRLKQSTRYQVSMDDGQLRITLNAFATVTGATVTKLGGNSLLTISLDKAASYRIMRLSNPERLVVDIPGADKGQTPSSITVNEGAVKGLRVEHYAGGTRIVADLAYYISHTQRSAARTNKVEISLLTAGLAGKLIVLDPGHGGSDPGAVGPTTRFEEKAGTIDIAATLKALLEKAGAKVLMTRTTDDYVALSGRTDMANKAQADLFLSIHHNSHTNRDANGIEVLYSTGEERQRLATAVQQELINALGLRNRGIVSRPEIYVTRESKMVSALAEIGFISNKNEEALIKDPAFRQKAATALFNGLNKFFSVN